MSNLSPTVRDRSLQHIRAADDVHTSQRMLWVLGLLMLLSAGVLATLSMARFRGYDVGMLDLGNMAQAIGSVRRGAPLVYTTPDGNMSRLSGHAEIIYLLLVPLMELWRDPQVLLLAQALLFVSGAIPVYRIAARRLPPSSSVWFAGGYLLYPTAVAAVLFDVHGDTLAMPLLLWLLDALDARAWRRMGVFLILSLLSKFYIAAPVFVLGCSLLTARTAPLGLSNYRHRRRVGLAICAASVVYGAALLLGVRPAFDTGVSNVSGSYLRYYFGGLLALDLAGILDRVINVLAVLLPSALLFWWSPWTALPALAIIGPAVLSTGPGAAYAWSYHHYAAAVPFIVVASIDGAARRVQRVKSLRLQQREAKLIGMIFGLASLLFHVGLNETPLGIPFWQTAGSGSAYSRSERDALKDRWLPLNVPADAPTAASNFLAPHLFDRDTLFLLRYPDEPRAQRFQMNQARVDVAVADALFDYYQPMSGGYAGGLDYDTDPIRQLLALPEWSLTAARDGLLRFERNAAPERVLTQTIRAAGDSAPAAQRFGAGIELVMSKIEPVNSRRFRATFRWRAAQDFTPDQRYVAVSRLEGVAQGRMVHLPSYVLAPTTTWRAGQVWEEQFEIEVPGDLNPGRYEWRTGWYDVASPFAAATDERSRVGVEAVITTIEVR